MANYLAIHLAMDLTLLDAAGRTAYQLACEQRDLHEAESREVRILDAICNDLKAAEELKK